MFREVEAELARRGWSKKELAKKTGISYSSLLDKMSGRTSFTFDECIEIKRAIQSDMPLEKLFFYQS